MLRGAWANKFPPQVSSSCLDKIVFSVQNMPTVEQNLQLWNTSYGWTQQGEEWSSTWGGSEAQWHGAILPRIRAFIPTDTILEIAPGFGRWTNFLKHWCSHLTIIDLAESCIKVCQQRFATDSHITYCVNDGKSLAVIPDSSIDFVFSFDSLVHAEADVIEGYLNQLARKLKPDGVGFIHHSNIGEFGMSSHWIEKMPGKLRRSLTEKGWLDRDHGRAHSMTAEIFEEYCDRVGLQCIGQELVNWGTKKLIDCFSVFTLRSSRRARPNKITRNCDFMREAAMIRRLSELYNFT